MRVARERELTCSAAGPGGGGRSPRSGGGILPFAILLHLVACGSTSPDAPLEEPRAGLRQHGTASAVPRGNRAHGPGDVPLPTGDERRRIHTLRRGSDAARRVGARRARARPPRDRRARGEPPRDRPGRRRRDDRDGDGRGLLRAERARRLGGATFTIELFNEGARPHDFHVPGQGIDLRCGVRARDEVRVTFPRSGVLLFSCTYTASSGMRGALVAGP